VFLAAFFAGWTGAPYFLIGAIGMGIAIVSLCCGGCLLTAIGVCFDDKHEVFAYVRSLGIIAGSAALVWSFATWIMVAAGTGPFKNEVGEW
jgi:hypothetical protein